MQFSASNNIVVSRLMSINSRMFHFVINGCNNIKMQNMKLLAPSQSPNTDGIHVMRSSGVTITGTDIRTGDDCISIGPGSTNLWMENLRCGPGHGIRFVSNSISVTSCLNRYDYKTECLYTNLCNGLVLGVWHKVWMKLECRMWQWRILFSMDHKMGYESSHGEDKAMVS